LNNKARYKYFNLVVRTLIGIASILFIYFKIKDSFTIQYQDFVSLSINYFFLFFAFLLSFLNWGLETYKWRFVVLKIQPLDFVPALKIVFTGITLSLITPNRIGEIPARAYLLNSKEHVKSTMYATFISSSSQLLLTLLIGLFGVIFTLNLIDIHLSNTFIVILSISISLLFLMFIFSDKLKKLLLKLIHREETIAFNEIDTLKFLGFSLLRYLVFCLQYLFILEAFGIHFTSFIQLWLIPVCFLLASSIPTFVLSEIGVRSSVAILVFGILTDNDLSIVLAASFLWIINIGLPATYGLFFLNQLKIKK
jgi:hypothetical protein